MIFGLSDGTSGGFLCVRFREISRNVSWYSYDASSGFSIAYALFPAQ